MKRIGLILALCVFALVGVTLLVRALRERPAEWEVPLRKADSEPCRRTQPAPTATPDKTLAGPTDLPRLLEALAGELGKPSSVEALTRKAAELS